jgi:hypothetical protein
MINFIPWLLYSWGKHLQYPLKWKLSAPQSQSGSFGGKIPLAHAGK